MRRFVTVITCAFALAGSGTAGLPTGICAQDAIARAMQTKVTLKAVLQLV